MTESINKQLQIIEKSNQWVADTESMRGAKGINAHTNFVNYRRKLNKKKFALEEQPAVAIYGESQVGKSYLVSSLLAVNGNPFFVVDGDGKEYDFINKINPIGRGNESTSLVTRFSTNYKLIHPNFPIKAKLLSPSDIVLILCDSFYNDIKLKVNDAITSNEIDDKLVEISKRYENQKSIQQVFLEDHILDIKDYFEENFSTKATNIVNSEYFEKTARIIDKIEPKFWSEVFSLLWNENTEITKLFTSLIEHYKQLKFSDEVYLPISSVLRDYGTLLDVDRIKEINSSYRGTESNYQPVTNVLIISDGEEEIKTFPKSFLCALSSELIFSLPEKLNESKPFLNNTDLLDFPGARHRLNILESDIDESIIPKMLLRGKVAYLFSKYSNFEKVNILLFCHNDHQSTQSVMPKMLNDWIHNMIGKTPEERGEFIKSSKNSPFFMISTMFNKDLTYDYNNDSANNRSFKDDRWERRFLKVIKDEIIDTNTYKWLENWTDQQKNFQNIFLLRDFYYSSETNSKIYDGYNLRNKELQEILPENYPDFRKDLKQSFIEYEFVKNHFESAGLSWDKAVNINEDGSQLIIDKLTITSENINKTRTEKINKDISDLCKGLHSEVKKYYHDSDVDELLNKAKINAGKIRLNLDLAFGKNPYFFAFMLKEFMISEIDVYNLFLKTIKNLEKSKAKDSNNDIGILINVKGLDPKKDFSENLAILSNFYNYGSLEECQVVFEEKGINLEELFYGQLERAKSFSQSLVESLENYWFENYIQKQTKTLLDIFSETGLQELQGMIKTLYRKHNISKIIVEKLRGYVDNQRNIEGYYGMISDMSAEVINSFVNTLGIEYLSDDQLRDLEEANDQNELNLVFDHSSLEYEIVDKAQVASLIDSIGRLPELLNQRIITDEVKKLPNYSNYIKWYDYVKIGFISVCDIPNYDVNANDSLKSIIDELESVHL